MSSDLDQRRWEIGLHSREDWRRKALERLMPGGGAGGDRMSSVGAAPGANVAGDAAAEGQVKTGRGGIAVQTEPVPTVTVSTGGSITMDGTARRTDSLSLALPPAHIFPLLTTAQLLEVEHKLQELLAKLEQGIIQAEKEVPPPPPPQKKAFETVAEWNDRMRGQVETRLRSRHADPDGVALPSQWHRSKLDAVASPPRPEPGQTSSPASSLSYSPSRSAQRKQDPFRHASKHLFTEFDFLRKPAAPPPPPDSDSPATASSETIAAPQSPASPSAKKNLSPSRRTSTPTVEEKRKEKKEKKDKVAAAAPQPASPRDPQPASPRDASPAKAVKADKKEKKDKADKKDKSDKKEKRVQLP